MIVKAMHLEESTKRVIQTRKRTLEHSLQTSGAGADTSKGK